jgi:microsomal dipeptidase-like Zn-dependent dipeptidase
MQFPQPLDWHQIHYDKATIVDLHAHPSLNVSLFNRLITSRVYPSTRAFDPFSVRTNIPQLVKGGVDALLSVIYAPERGIVDECKYVGYLRYLMPRTWKKIYQQPYFQVTQLLLDEIEAAVQHAKNPHTGNPLAKFVYSVEELDEVLSQGKGHPIALVHCIEGGHCLDGKLENLDAFFHRGVAYLVLAHFFENELVHPCFPWPEKMQKFGCFRGERNNVALGLKKFGEEVIERMIELGMLIDISHCTPLARSRIYDIVGQRSPLIASHVGAYQINPDPYNLQDWELKKIADSGGMTGVIFMNYWLMPHETGRGLNFISHTIEHMVNVAGLEHVGIGSDFDGFTDPPDDLKDASELPRLTQRLIAEGFSEEAILKIWGGNALRVIRQGWGRKKKA